MGRLCQLVVSGGCHPVVALSWLMQKELQVLGQVWGSMVVVGSFSQKN